MSSSRRRNILDFGLMLRLEYVWCFERSLRHNSGVIVLEDILIEGEINTEKVDLN